VVSSKEFLNELVKRFPEIPRNIGATHIKILELIGEWRITLGENSRHKADFKHIGEMYKLLEYKGN
jgi:hypothetical protein